MNIQKWFIKLMKGELKTKQQKKKSIAWVIDENKYLSTKEVVHLKAFCLKTKEQGFQKNKFSLVRNWFMRQRVTSV